MAQPAVHWKWTPSHFLQLPKPIPRIIPSPTTEFSARAPFGINETLYNFALRPEIPIIVASTYMLAVFYLNAYNRTHKQTPWQISKTKAFAYFVVAHNVLLALYSFATFLAMQRAIAHSMPEWGAEDWSVRVADGLCKLHGPRGLGDAATFNTTVNIWEAKNTAIRLTGSGVPDPTDVGRLWNEGLAFWGWLFYVSKFYEVLDTLILLAKGKRSGTLQTYHHAGAMLCMWAGIRYMSPPIWMFVFVNSFIHALMYTYFTLSALGYKVPQRLKRLLTMLQIGQFLWGATYAAAHLFIQYDIPITTPFQIAHVVQHVASSASSAASSATSVISSVVDSPPAATAIGSFIKKLLLRAAGEEGVAERLALQNADPLITSTPQLQEKLHEWIEHRYETQYRTDWTRINCIDTSGEAFAIYLNLLYLSPLTYLFMRFFSRAYSQRARPRSASQALHEIAVSAREAKKDTQESVENAGIKAEEGLERTTSQAQEEVRKDVEKVRESMREGKVKEDVKKTATEAQKKVESAAEQAKKKAEEAKNSDAGKKAQGAVAKAQEKVEDVKKSDAAKKAQNAAQNTAQKARQAAEDFKNSDTAKKAENAAGDAAKKAQQTAEDVKQSDAAKKAQQTAEDVKQSDTAKKAQQTAEDVKQSDTAKKAQNAAESAAEKTRRAADDAAQSDAGNTVESYADAVKEGVEDTTAGAEESTTTSTTSESRGGGGLFRRSWSENEQITENDPEQSEETQDENLEESQALRPDPEEDTDAMGKSGAIVDAEDAE